MLDKNREQQYTNRAVRECSNADWIACGLVAQLDRVFDYESKGRGFESLRARQRKPPENKGFQGVFLFIIRDIQRNWVLFWVLRIKLSADNIEI